ncbi:MAG: helix-turn-helix transcriptional regulator [Planctomycetaceae bacterium]
MSDAKHPGSGGSRSAERATDAAVIDVLRVEDALGIGELSAALGVTATAVRQRLARLMRAGLVERRTLGGRRGRPAHAYSLTEAGKRRGGDNFRELAIVLWRELRGVRDAEIRRGLIGRIGSALAGFHRVEVSGSDPATRLRGVAEIMRGRDIACTCEDGGADGRSAPVLTNYTCPYPDLAEQDRGICAAERVMIEELVGDPVRLAECRLDGGSCCRFSLGPTDTAARVPAATSGRDLQTSP